TSGASLVAIERDRTLLQPTAKTRLLAGDILLVDLFAPKTDVEALLRQYALELLPLPGPYFSDRSQEIGMAEGIVPANSELVGRTVAEAGLRDGIGLTVMGLRRGRAAHGRGLQNETLKLGDTLLLIGPWKAIERLQSDRRDLVIMNLPAEVEDVLPVPGKALQALLLLTLVVRLLV